MAELGFELAVAHPSRRALGRAGLRGLATLTWWPCVPSNGFCAASSHGLASPWAFLGLLCRDRASLFSDATAAGLYGSPSTPEKLVLLPGEQPHVTAWFGGVMDCGPRQGLEKQWGRQAGVSGEQSKENPKAVAIPEPPHLA